VAAAIQMRTEMHPIFGDAPELLVAEHLKTATIGQYGPIPGHKPMQPAQGLDGFMTWPQVQVVCVAQKDLHLQLFQELLGHGLDACACSYRHEYGRFNNAVSGPQTPQASIACRVIMKKSEVHHDSQRIILHLKPEWDPRQERYLITSMFRVGIIGGRISGSHLAKLLAGQGMHVKFFDHRTEKEKACGGGMTYKAYRNLPGLTDSGVSASHVSRMVMINSDYPLGITTDLEPPLLIYSRRELDDYLRGAAIRSGAQWINEKVIDIVRDDDQWTLQTPRGSYRCDFLVGADGVRSLLKCRLDRPFAKTDLSLALGYYVPGTFHQDTIFCRFFESPFMGYLWSFPRRDHLSVGIIDRLDRADPREMRSHIQEYIGKHYPAVDLADCREYAAPIPTLSIRSLESNIIGTKRWAVIGDAAGFADPITGEGIFYALRSSELLADCLSRQAAESYPERCEKDFVSELKLAARWKKLFYQGIGGRLPLHRFALGLAARSFVFSSVISDWTAGTASYSAMPGRILKALPRIVGECIAGKKDDQPC
jgi:flavin-dependent dehydrogenase